MKSAVKRKVNNALSKLAVYHDDIPFALIRSIVESIGGTVVLDIDGSPLEGVLFCGRQGQSVFALKDSRYGLLLAWYRMESGRYEIVTYIN